MNWTTELATPVSSSATGAAAALAPALAAVSGRMNYITGFQITGAGATAASIIAVTLTGVIGGTITYYLVIPAGATASITPLVVTFPIPLQASATNIAITLNVPSFGTGNTNAAASLQGFYQ
jgi:hypothetical protein